MKATSPVLSQTQHPFGDPAATQYHQRDALLVELMRRRTNPHLEPITVEPDPLAPVSGEISVPARHGWTVVAVALLVVALAACAASALLL